MYWFFHKFYTYLCKLKFIINNYNYCEMFFLNPYEVDQHIFKLIKYNYYKL